MFGTAHPGSNPEEPITLFVLAKDQLAGAIMLLLSTTALKFHLIHIN